MKRKGFTLVELLVVIAIIALLMSILMPALSKVRELATRVVCGSHLSSIGKQMMVYANEQEDSYPRAGGKYSKWGPLPAPSSTSGWCAFPIDQGGGIGTFGEPAAFRMPTNNPITSPNRATISASLYYLIKFADASPKVFVCGGDAGVKSFQVSEFGSNIVYNNNLLEAWDFGPSTGSNLTTRNYYSYAMQSPYVVTGMPGNYPISPLSDSSIAILADATPYIVKNPVANLRPYFKARTGGYSGTVETERMGNSENHKRNGQNVLYNDGHVVFADNPCVGFDGDNIYSMASFDGTTRTDYVMEGTILLDTAVREWSPAIYPMSKTDSVLLNEGNGTGTAASSQGGVQPTPPPG